LLSSRAAKTGLKIIDMKPIRLAVAGAGLIGKRHIDTITQCPEAELVGVVDPQSAAAAYASSLGANRYESISEMLATARPDGVIIATPNQMHVEHGLACVSAGIPVLIEKPISSDVPSAERLVGEAEAAGVPILVGHHRRHNPIITAAKARIASGEIGEIVAVHGICWLYKPDDYFGANWRKQAGAGPVLINLIHDIDLLRYLCGEVRTVQAFDSNRVRGHQVEDTAAIIMAFDNGALATVTVSDTIVAPWSWELTAGENPAYPNTGQSCYFIGGTHGSLEIPGGKVWSNPSQRSWWEPINSVSSKVDEQDPLHAQISHFCRVISRSEKPIVSGREGLRTLQVVEVIKRAANSGTLVHLASDV
jgi:predicted dehydrogenase